MSAKCLHSSVAHQQMSVLNGCFYPAWAIIALSSRLQNESSEHMAFGKMNVKCSSFFLYGKLISLPSAFFILMWRFQETKNCIWVILCQNKSMKSFRKIIVLCLYQNSLSGLTEKLIMSIQQHKRKEWKEV